MRANFSANKGGTTGSLLPITSPHHEEAGADKENSGGVLQLKNKHTTTSSMSSQVLLTRSAPLLDKTNKGDSGRSGTVTVTPIARKSIPTARSTFNVNPIEKDEVVVSFGADGALHVHQDERDAVISELRAALRESLGENRSLHQTVKEKDERIAALLEQVGELKCFQVLYEAMLQEDESEEESGNDDDASSSDE